MTVALLATKAAAKGIEMIKNSLDDAIKRFDTMNKFPKMMEALGYSAVDADKSIKRLSEGIDGLPTALDDVVASTQNLALITGDLDTATETTLALNDAFLASGASSADASRGLTQYVQMLSAGKVDMQSWKTLMETMPYALTKVAESFGYVGASAKNDLYSALQSGQITFDQFNQKLVELDGGLNGFADLARKNSEGIATSFQNIKTAVTKGVTEVITSFDKMVKKLTGKNIAQNLNSLKGVVNNVFKSMSKSVEIFGDALVVLGPGIKVATVGLLAFKASLGISKVIKSATTALAALNAMEQANALLLVTVNGGLTAKQALLGLLTGKLSIATVATGALASAQNALNVAWASNPIGVVIAGITALVGITAVLTKGFGSNTEAAKKLKAEQKDLASSAQEVIDSVNNSKAAFDSNIKSIDSTAGASKNLADKVFQTAKSVKNGTADIGTLQGYIDMLNSSVDGLNLSYDSLSGTFNMSEAAVYSQIDALKELAKQQAIQEAYVDAEKKRLDIMGQLAEMDEKTAPLHEKAKEALNGRTDSVTNFTKEEVALVEKERELGEALGETEARITFLDGEMQTNIQTMQNSSTEAGNMALSYDEMSTTAQGALDRVLTAYETMSSGLMNLNNEIKLDSSTTWETVKANQDDVIAKTTEFANIYAELIKNGISESYLQAIGATGPQALPMMRQMSEEIAQGGADGIRQKQSEWESAFKDIQTGAVNGLQMDDSVRQALNDYISGEAGVMGTLQQALDGADFGQVGTAINEKVSTSTQEAVANSETGTQTGNAIVQDINNGVTESAEQLSTSGQAIASNIQSSVNEAVGANDYTAVGTKIVSDINLGVQSQQGNISTTISTLFAQISTSISTYFMQMNKAAQTGMTTMKTMFSTSLMEMVNKTKTGMTQMQTAIKTGMSNSQAAVTLACSSMKRETGTLQAAFYSDGYNAGVGLGNGITAGGGTALSAAQSLANQIKATIQSAMDIHSPSRWMRDFIGKNMMLGWADGFARYDKYPQMALASSIGNVTLPALNAEKILGRGAQGINGRSVSNIYNASYNNSPEYIMLDNTITMNDKEVGKGVSRFVAVENKKRENKFMRMGVSEA